MSRGPYSNCKSCGTPVIWLVTRNGKRIPVLRVDNNEQPVRPGETFDRVIHVAHFADCKDAAQHRKPREDKAAYVREQSKGPQPEHHCHARGCKVQVPPAKFMCLRSDAIIDTPAPHMLAYHHDVPDLPPPDLQRRRPDPHPRGPGREHRGDRLSDRQDRSDGTAHTGKVWCRTKKGATA